MVYFRDRHGDLDEKGDIYAVLVAAVQEREDWAELAAALLWLGLWPGLTRIYGRYLPFFGRRPDQLVCEIGYLFTAMVARIDLSGVTRLAATLVRNIQRDVNEYVTRRDTGRPQDADWSLYEEKFDAGRPGIQQRALPVDASDPRALRQWLAGIVGKDADLVIGAVVYEIDQSELGDILGVSHDAARKRYQRAIKKLRPYVTK